jgi:hypothetical protein
VVVECCCDASIVSTSDIICYGAMVVTEFEITQDQLNTLLAAMKPVAMIMLQCGTPRSPQENANDAWARLGVELGFDPMTVRPNGKGDRFFSAKATTQ